MGGERVNKYRVGGGGQVVVYRYAKKIPLMLTIGAGEVGDLQQYIKIPVVDFADSNINLPDKIQAICRWLVFYPTKLC